MATYYKINTNTGEMDLHYQSRLDRATVNVLNYAYALNGVAKRLMTLKQWRKVYLS